MHEHLTIAVWAAPTTLDTRLTDLEEEIIVAWGPPLNLRGAPRPSPQLKSARKAMAAEAARWVVQHGPTAAITSDTGSPRTAARN